ncbi:MAG: ABC transporter ATP-binding protein, partial [Fusobacteriaceae bacterium]|nr:ABC transporter ATP-binding protein [Fusobacteriaceae bacterium]
MKILEITSLYKKYENLDVLSDININLNKGEFVSIVGPSGCGKSTLFKIITGLDKYFEGLCLLEETDVKNYKNPLAYMPQKDLLLPWRTLYENIILPLELHNLKINLDQINLMIEDF